MTLINLDFLPTIRIPQPNGPILPARETVFRGLVVVPYDINGTCMCR